MSCERLEVPMPSPAQLANLAAAQAPAIWLDSALAGHPHAQASLLVLQPLRRWGLSEGKEFRELAAELDHFLHTVPRFDPEGLPFCGGLVGYLAYPSSKPGAGLPAAQFFAYDTGLALDHLRNQAWVFSLGLEEGGEGSDPAVARRRCEALAATLASASAGQGGSFQLRSLRAQISKETYLAKVRDIQERIRRGDCYQVNFSQGFTARGAWDPADLYLRLRSASPAPQMAFCNLGEAQILSASPETLLEVEGEWARSFPIKGTRRRDPDPELDRRLAEELLRSPKDAAELLMIVDLVRNDLGRCCRVGSVAVPQLKALDSLPQVHHLYAEVRGRLLAGVGPFQALEKLSPGGSITGAPKLKAMEIIDALEAVPRGLYTGSLGHAGFDGRASFNIAIRSALLRGERLGFSAGGGIVADSDPELEYEECLHKARGFFEALGLPDFAP
ncbi:MAG: anthranilate synthase component I family protein [bacterium]